MGYIDENKTRIVEGELRIKELNLYLEKLNLLKMVWLAEDATHIESRVEFDPHTNQMVGLVQPIDRRTGMPIPYTYLAEDFNSIQVNMKRDKSSYAYVVMAQPLSMNVPPFTLQLFGNDNKFTTEHVLSRWKHTVEQLKK